MNTLKNYVRFLWSVFARKGDRYSLKYVTKSLASKNQHLLYEFVIICYDYKVIFEKGVEKKFKGRGWGTSSLNN